MALRARLIRAVRGLPGTTRQLRARWRDWYALYSLQFKIGVLTTLLVLTYLAPQSVVFIYPGQAGVLWRRFFGGTDTEYVMNEGTRLKLPWDQVYLYDVRLQTETQNLNVLTQDGLQILVEITVRFRAEPQHLGLLHKYVGPDYIRTLIVPQVTAHGREEMAQLKPEDLFSDKRNLVQQTILERLQQAFDVQYMPHQPGKRLIYIQEVLVRSIVLPSKVAEAIQEKLVQKQRLLEYDYLLQIEEKERERKRIEGEGIQQFQAMVTQGISDEFLRWQGIIATLELARSDNAKIVVIGAGKDGLPIILGNTDFPSQAAKSDSKSGQTDTGKAPSMMLPRLRPEWSMGKPDKPASQ